MADDLLKVRDVMRRLNISRRTVYYWVSEGVLKPVRIGSVFRFQPEDIDHLIESGRSAVSVKPKKILAIDDDILVRESIKTLLGRAGYLVTVASDGPTALTLLVKHEFDLILVDMRMPGMDGLETLKAIRRARQKAQKKILPEIMMSAYEDAPVLKEAAKLGVRKFITKPFELDDFLELIRQHIN